MLPTKATLSSWAQEFVPSHLHVALATNPGATNAFLAAITLIATRKALMYASSYKYVRTVCATSIVPAGIASQLGLRSIALVPLTLAILVAATTIPPSAPPAAFANKKPAFSRWAFLTPLFALVVATAWPLAAPEHHLAQSTKDQATKWAAPFIADKLKNVSQAATPPAPQGQGTGSQQSGEVSDVSGIDMSKMDMSNMDMSSSGLTAQKVANLVALGAKFAKTASGAVDLSNVDMSAVEPAAAKAALSELTNLTLQETSVGGSKPKLPKIDLANIDLAHADLTAMKLSKAALSALANMGAAFPISANGTVDLSNVDLSSIDPQQLSDAMPASNTPPQPTLPTPDITTPHTTSLATTTTPPATTSQAQSQSTLPQQENLSDSAPVSKSRTVAEIAAILLGAILFSIGLTKKRHKRRQKQAVQLGDDVSSQVWKAWMEAEKAVSKAAGKSIPGESYRERHARVAQALPRVAAAHAELTEIVDAALFGGAQDTHAATSATNCVTAIKTSIKTSTKTPATPAR